MIRIISSAFLIVLLAIASIGLLPKPSTDAQRTEIVLRQNVSVPKFRDSNFLITPHLAMGEIVILELLHPSVLPSYTANWYKYHYPLKVISLKPKPRSSPQSESFFFIYTPKATCTQDGKGDIIQAHF